MEGENDIRKFDTAQNPLDSISSALRASRVAVAEADKTRAGISDGRAPDR